MSNEQSVEAIVLDAGPILQNSPSVSTLFSKSKKIFTSPSIVAEIKDINARRRFETTLGPFIAVKTPSPISIKFVTEFARKTGDLAVLSKADVEILSLAYELEHEKIDGEDRFDDDPSQFDASVVTSDAVTALRPPTDLLATVPEPGLGEALECTPVAPWAQSTAPPLEQKPDHPKSVEQDSPLDPEKEASIALEEPVGELQKSLGAVSIDTMDEKEDPSPPSKHEDSSEVISTPQLEDHDSEESDGWITPANIKRVQAAEKDKSNSTSAVKAPIRTAIITTDFAMQNVALQIGLNLLSSNLNRISNIRTYVLRCHACFQTVKDTSKQFCPRCGNPTLTRVSCSTNAKGEFRIHLKKNMQWNHRGDRYSIPKPVPGQSNGKVGRGKGGGKGGWGQELILTEDQKEYQRAVGSNGRSKGIDLMDEDYLPGILTGNRGRPGGRPKVGAGRNVNSKKRI